ncbi:hypothetical protein [Nocardioides sp.]|uniref:hypothetical protein n=1 Tax=Nocardioides sp. TaxID=35761 RepID=UPI0031FED63C|nr:hypothetical protein [Nocardioides sp.]
MTDPDTDDADAGSVEERPSRRARRAHAKALGRLDPDAATALVQRSADAERATSDPWDEHDTATSTVSAPVAEGAERAVIDALAAGLGAPHTIASPDEEDRRRFRRRRHHHVDTDAPDLPKLTSDQAASAVQPAAPDERVPRPRRATDEPEPARPLAAQPQGERAARDIDGRARRLSASPQGLASAEHVALRRAAEAAATEQSAFRLVAEESAAQAAQARLVAEQSAREHAESLAVALAARLEAEEAATRNIGERQRADEAAIEAARGRALAEETARELAARAESESTHRAVAEGQAARAAADVRIAEERLRVALEEAVEQQQALAVALQERAAAEVAAAEHARARAEAEESATRLATDRVAVEIAVRRNAELAEEAVAARLVAEEHARELAAALEATRDVLLNETRAPRAWWQQARPVFMPEVRASARGAHGVSTTDDSSVREDVPPRTGRHVEPAETQVPTIATPTDADETINFQARRGGAMVSPVLAGAALLSAAITAFLTFRGDLLTGPGIIAAVATILLIIGVARTRTPSTTVWVDRGTVHLATGATTHQFDLTSPNTRIEMVGNPQSRGWKLLFLRRSLPPYVIDARVVDPVAFTETVRRWRPEL